MSAAGTSTMARMARLLMIGALLSGCALPRSGPDVDEILTLAQDPAIDFSIVPVTGAVATITRRDERLGFTTSFTEARVEPVETLAPGDLLSITVWESTEEGLLSPSGIGASPIPPVRIDGGGFINVPYVGRVRAAGRRISTVRETIRAALAAQTLNPQVDVQRVETTGRVISVQGRVNVPGIYPIERPTIRLLAMLARAGGVSEDPEVVRLRLRRGPLQSEIWLQDLYDNPGNDIAIHAGDALIAERDRRMFTALGAVQGPSTVPFPTRDLSLVRALGTVGGLVDQQADPTGVFVFRRESRAVAAQVVPGGVTAVDPRLVYIVDLTQPGGLFIAREFMIRDGDTIFVTTAPFAQWLKILQSLSPIISAGGATRSLTGL